MVNSADYAPSKAFETLGAPSGAPFWDAVEAAEFPKSILRFRNDRWAARVGLGDLDDAAWLAHFARFEPLPDNIERPLAVRYHGHQFRSYNPEIGDGRGFLFAQLFDGEGRLLDLATKGSGQTPYSRFGDGRLTLKGGVRELLATEMLEALGVYTSKTFSLVETGEALHRGDEPSPTRSAVMVRLGHSHVRFGAFQRLASEGGTAAIGALVDYCVRHFDPDLAAAPMEKKTAAFFHRVVARSARLTAQWMAAGFVHGVLNTDNMNVTGESFDYGPWRFLPTMDPSFTAAYFDQTGLYAYGRQPDAVMWNLSRLGGVLLALSNEDALNAALQDFGAQFERAMADAFFARLGLTRAEGRNGADYALVSDFMQWLHKTDAPFEQVMFDLFGGAAGEARRARSPLAALYGDSGFEPISAKMNDIEPDRPARLYHAYFQGERPCGMLIDEMEALWAPIADADDWAPLEAKIDTIRAMGAAYDFAASVYEQGKS